MSGLHEFFNEQHMRDLAREIETDSTCSRCDRPFEALTDVPGYYDTHVTRLIRAVRLFLSSEDAPIGSFYVDALEKMLKPFDAVVLPAKAA